MFYTKYRPTNFSEISRPNDAADALVKQILDKKTAHAYLFVGPRGTGKTTTARVLAKALNCSHLEKNGDPCGKCDSCVSIASGRFVDLIEIDAASNRGIDDIRELQETINLSPVLGKKKVYIVDEVHMLTPQAFNALLKTLEEPPEKVVFILCTTESHKVPDTIKSRCQVFRFKRATIDQLVKKLHNISQSEGGKVSKQDLEKIASASLGGFRDAETLLQQFIEGDLSIDSLSTYSSLESLCDFNAFLIEKDTKNALDFINNVYQEGIDLYVWCGEYLKYLRELLLLKSGVVSALLDSTESLLVKINKQAEIESLEYLVSTIEIFSTEYANIKKSAIMQLPLELAIVKVTNAGYSANPTLLIKPIKPILPETPTNLATTKSSKSIALKIATSDKLTDKTADKKSQSINVVEESDISTLPEIPLTFGFSFIEEKWEEVLNKMHSINGPIMAILKSAVPLRLEDNSLILEVYFPFHKERLESIKNRILLETTLSEILGATLRVKCCLNQEKPKKLKDREVGILTDINVVPVDSSKLMEALDGGLPL